MFMRHQCKTANLRKEEMTKNYLTSGFYLCPGCVGSIIMSTGDLLETLKATEGGIVRSGGCRYHLGWEKVGEGSYRVFLEELNKMEKRHE